MLSDLERLPGQKVNISPRLQRLFNQARTECNRNIKFGVVSPEQQEQFEGRIEWRDNDILIEMKDTFDNPMAEYIAAHELCHALQLARGYPITAGRVDEPGAVAIATHITDFAFDSPADAMALEFGFPMASGFERWLKSTGILQILKKPKNGRRYGNKWIRVWETLEETTICHKLRLKLPKPPREFWTLWVAFDFANIIQRASNFGLAIGHQIREDIKRLPLLSNVVNDLLNIGAPSGICGVEESLSKLIRIFGYIKPLPGHIFIHKPLTDEFYIKGSWQPRPKGENATTKLLKELIPKVVQKIDSDLTLR